MAIEFKLPEIGEGTAEGEIVKWLVAEGDVVTEDQPLVEVMTDKATVEIPSPRAGRIESLRAREGEVVAVGAVILAFGEGDASATAPAASAPAEASATPVVDGEAAVAAPAAPAPAAPAVHDTVRAARERARAELQEPPAPARPWDAPPAAPGRAAAAPATRRLARELGVDLLEVAGSGRDGRITKEDVLAFAEQGAAPAEAATAPAVAAAAAPAPAPTPPATAPAPARPPAPGLEERVPVRGLRRKIAERMRAAKLTIPHFTYVEECDMTEIVQLRERAKEIGAPRGIKVTYLPFIVRALVEAAKRHPTINSSFDEQAGEIVLKRYYNVGIATATERGLIVPVVKNADRLGVFDLAREIERLASDAREGRSQLEDLQGGTITITSTGNIGGILATPIINHPEVAILGVTAIRKRPVVRDDAIVVRDMVNLSLSLDHRIVDGADGALFMRDLVSYLEDPKLLVLGSP